MGAHFKLVADIIFSPDDFIEAGEYYNNGEGFLPITGQSIDFNGDGYKIVALTQTIPSQRQYAGLFGTIEQGELRNLNLQDLDINIAQDVTVNSQGLVAGGFVGLLKSGIVENCSSSGEIYVTSIQSDVSSQISVGGIIGEGLDPVFSGGVQVTNCVNKTNIHLEAYNQATLLAGGISGNGGIIRGCQNYGVVSAKCDTNPVFVGGISGYGYSIVESSNHGNVSAFGTMTAAGGLVGYLVGPNVSKCYNTASINAQSNADHDTATAGGIAGYTQYQNSCDIDNCFNTGTIEVQSKIVPEAAGIVGHFYGSKISNSYNLGPIISVALEGESYLGGIIGNGSGQVVENCYYLDNVANAAGWGYSGAVKLTIDQMSSILSFPNLDFTSTWQIGNSDSYPYPELQENVYTGERYYAINFYTNTDTIAKKGWSLPGNLITPPQVTNKTGYTIAGWVKSNLIDQWDYLSDLMPDSELSLYAKWIPNPYALNFNANGGSGTMATQQMTYDASQTLSPNSYKRTGYTFAGWAKTSTGSVAFADKASVKNLTATNGGTVNLYAKWTPITYAVKFYANGGSGTMSPIYLEYDSAQTIPSCTFKKTGYSFLGWATSATGSVVYKNLASVKNLTATNHATLGLYAKWGASITSAATYNYNSIKVSWAYAGSATSYKIYRATSVTGTYSLVKTAASTSRYWIDTNRVTGMTYYYKVYPVAGGKTYTHSTYKYAKAVPATPSVSLSKSTSTSIKVTWSGVSGASGYQIYRATSSTGTYSLVYTASSTLRSWTNPGLTTGKTYYYKVRAYHLEGTTKVYGSCSTVKSLKL